MRKYTREETRQHKITKAIKVARLVVAREIKDSIELGFTMPRGHYIHTTKSGRKINRVKKLNTPAYNLNPAKLFLS